MLTPDQKLRAGRLQKAGKLLREIAAAIGASFEEVSLWLYGGVEDWTPTLGTPAAPKPDVAPWLEPGGPPPPPLYYPPEQNPEIARVRQQEPHREEKSVHVVGDRRPGVEPLPQPDPADRVSAAAPSPEPRAALAASDGAELAAASQAEAAAAAAAPPAKAEPESPPRYRLKNDIGEWLHESGHGMTRNPRLAWAGTAQQLEAAMKRKPHLQELDAEPVR